MLYETMCYCNNFFAVPGAARFGRIEIREAEISLPSVFLLPGQYFIIRGSVLNNGLHQNGDVLLDESFCGEIIPIAIPIAFHELVNRMQEYREKNADSPFQTESFGGYSYSRAADSDTFAHFKNELSIWRKI